MNSSTIRRSIGLTGSLARQKRVNRSSPLPAAQDPQAGPSGSKAVTEEAPENRLFNHSQEQKDEDKPQWLIHKEALRRKFPDGWNPPKKISRPSMALLRTLHQTDPNQFSLSILSEKFKISPEAVRRILRSKWEPNQETAKKTEQRQQTVGAAHSSDGWVHHEKLETDQIPLNLAHTLQSSLPSSSKISSSSFPRKSQPRSSYSHFKK
ncbi:Required for respiratory growth protein 9 mitochondrial [Puccinia graminis f. sp. tritici]|uniref:Required for respiratory growth protein 9, mitochondrial n=1 Tax=Puccinia graminis f. sp. tritici TaxID=56615 RepID=A0A5B0MWK4_PUCGR|nr:Required for respiratory growth protein 9 mitochondrial [Puccinia graminis f. sp. tritici]KAA1131369.1 Required for respiratory growth protein 9 mitochondrial [Puccinia graminis f. sp. tritici]